LILTGRVEPEEPEGGEVVAVEEDVVWYDLVSAHYDPSDGEEYDDGTEERRLVIVEEETESNAQEQDTGEDVEDAQPLDLSIPRLEVVSEENFSDASVRVPTPNPVMAVEQGPSGQGGAVAIESPPLVQGQSVILYPC
jgi:hypothetical protein